MAYLTEKQLKKQKVIIFGAGDLAKTLYSYLLDSKYFEVIAFCVDDEYKTCDSFMNVNLISFSQLIEGFNPKKIKMLLAFGYSTMRLRENFFIKIKNAGFDFINYIHHSIDLPKNLDMGEGNILFPNVTIEPSVRIGSNNIFWTAVNICHDVEVGSHNFIASQSLLGGFSKVGNGTFIGFNATILQSIIVGNEVLIGAKSLVTKNTIDFGKYIGIPAILVSSHKEQGIRIR